MIKIHKPARPAFMEAAGNKWDIETDEAILHYSADPIVGEFVHKAYADPRIRAELKKIFGKCAYCESKYLHTADSDIEHFRPKGRVNEKTPKTPGYYWLANDWDNLLLSCQHCNQKRIHDLDGDDRAKGAGKLDQFPLSDNSKRVSHHTASLKEEEKVRLLINPSAPDDFPETHFEYEPSKGAMIGISEMGKTSIEVFALRRKELVEERNQRRIELFTQIDTAKRALELYATLQVDALKNNLDIAINNLLVFTEDKKPYAGMCRFFVRKFLSENNLLS